MKSLDTGAMVTSSGALENRESVSTAVSQAVKLMGLYHHQPRSTTAAAEGAEDEAISGQTYKKVHFLPHFFLSSVRPYKYPLLLIL